MENILVDKIATWDYVRSVQSFIVSPNLALVEKLHSDHRLYVERSFLNATMYVKKSWIVGINAKKFVIMENVNAFRKLLLSADVVNKTSKQSVEEKHFV